MSKNLKGKNAFTSLRMNRAAEEEIMKYNNNAIHLAYSANKNTNQNYNNISKNINPIKISNGSSEVNNTNYQTKNRNNSSKKKENNNEINKNITEYKIKTRGKKNKSGIIINIYSRKSDKDEISINDENYFDNENEQNQTENEEFENLRNKKDFDEFDAVSMVKNMWIKNNKISNESNVEIYNVNNNFNSNNEIIKVINFNIIPKNNKWEKEMKKENADFFTIYKTGLKLNKYLYTETNYLKDLSNSIFLSKEKENELYIINPPNKESLTKIKFTKINPKDYNELESDLLDYYTQNKLSYYTNIDNNDDIEEQKLKPIYVFSKPQITHLYNELNELKEEKRRDWGSGRNILSISRQVGVDYEIIEVFTPRLNKDNNTYRTLSNKNNNTDSNNNKEENIITSDINNMNNINNIKDKNDSKEFGQYTPIEMLNEKFFVYAISRNIKYSIPQNQGFINYLNYDKYKRKDYMKGNYQLQKNKFSLKITKVNNKIEINNNKRKNNIIDYSKYSSGSDKYSKK